MVMTNGEAGTMRCCDPSATDAAVTHTANRVMRIPDNLYWTCEMVPAARKSIADTTPPEISGACRSPLIVKRACGTELPHPAIGTDEGDVNHGRNAHLTQSAPCMFGMFEDFAKSHAHILSKVTLPNRVFVSCTSTVFAICYF